jgi:peroxiredoxin Q/BCP
MSMFGMRTSSKFSIAQAVLGLAVVMQIGTLSAGAVDHKMVAEGDQAPDFSLPCENGKNVSLKDFKGKKVVVFFYAKDSSATTKEEHTRIQKNYKKFKLKGVDVLCIGEDPVASHKAMNTQLNLDYHLLTDKSDKVRELYGLPPAVKGDKGRYAIVIDPKGTVKKVAGGDQGITDDLMSDLYNYASDMPGAGI